MGTMGPVSEYRRTGLLCDEYYFTVIPTSIAKIWKFPTPPAHKLPESSRGPGTEYVL